MSVRLSVIIPGYNTTEAWWKRCVDSVLKAIGPEDEIVLVDDGSREGLRIAEFESLKGLDGRIRIITKANGGLSSARNAALEIVSGRYVAFVDSDDVVLPEVYSKSIAAMERFGSDVAIFGVRTEWVEEGLYKDDIPELQRYPILLPVDIKRLSNACLMNYACNKVYRMDFLRRHQLRFDPEGMPCEDIIFNLQCVMSGARWCTVDYLGYVYYRTGMTLLSKYKPSNFTGLHHGSETWKKYKDMTPGAREVLGRRGEVTEADIAAAEKRNRLKPGSPYWFSPIYNFFRGLLYVRSVRRWNIRRMFPQAKEVAK